MLIELCGGSKQRESVHPSTPAYHPPPPPAPLPPKSFIGAVPVSVHATPPRASYSHSHFHFAARIDNCHGLQLCALVPMHADISRAANCSHAHATHVSGGVLISLCAVLRCGCRALNSSIPFVISTFLLFPMLIPPPKCGAAAPGGAGGGGWHAPQVPRIHIHMHTPRALANDKCVSIF